MSEENVTLGAERAATEAALDAEIFAKLGAGVIVTRAKDDVILRINARAALLLAATESELLGRSFREHIPLELREPEGPRAQAIRDTATRDGVSVQVSRAPPARG